MQAIHVAPVDRLRRARAERLTDRLVSFRGFKRCWWYACTHTCMSTWCPFGLTRFALMHFTLIVPLPAFILLLVLAPVAGYFLSVIARICHQR